MADEVPLNGIWPAPGVPATEQDRPVCSRCHWPLTLDGQTWRTPAGSGTCPDGQEHKVR